MAQMASTDTELSATVSPQQYVVVSIVISGPKPIKPPPKLAHAPPIMNG